MRYRIKYQTELHFEEPISEQQVELRLAPRDDQHQKLVSHRISTDPEAAMFAHRDAFGNQAHFFSLITPHDHLSVRLEAEIETLLINPFDYSMPSAAEERDAVKRLLREEPRNWDFVLPHDRTVPALSEIGSNIKWPGYDPEKNLIDSVQTAMEWIDSEFRYETGTTWVHCPLGEVLEKRSGVCQDFAHLLIAIVREWKFPARYVMGYQYLQPDQKEFPRQATHAWTEIYLPGAGWRGFDATHSLLANDTYIPVAVGRDSQDAAPERGSFQGKSTGNHPEVKLVLSQQ